MSDFNPLDRAKVAVHRSSFDLSSKKLFTAKIGEILPCYWQIAIPGNKYRISSDWFTRTVPVNTAAYTRIKEYYDFYAVPLRLISRALPQAFTQMSDYMTSAASSSANTDQLSNVPYAPVGNISGEILARVNAKTVDDAGFGFAYGSCKLLDMLGYGSFIGSSNPKKADITKQYLGLDTTSLPDSQNPLIYGTSVNLNLLPIFAYQKIYFDFYSNSQWEKHLAYAYNVDYWDGKSSVEISADMIKMRYANYPKDYFLGVLPASQYGSVAILSSLNSAYSPSNIIAAGSTSQTNLVNPASGSSSVITTTPNNGAESRNIILNSDLSALSIRATEYLQRWKEVVQFSSKDYSDQMAAQFGIKAPEYMGNHAHYIGGWSNVININEVLNTNLTADNSQAVIAGKGVGSQSGHAITYDCGAEHQVIMCVYHAVPLLDWSLKGHNPQLLCTSVSDFPQPAFDQLGMQPVPALALNNSPSAPIGNIGYNLRYWQWKSAVDTVHGAFRPAAAYQSWVAPLQGSQVQVAGQSSLSYQSFKIRPQQLNSIFEPQITTSNYNVAYDQLLCNVNFQVYAVQNLDRNGLPY
uniref:Major capsid protein n=1 Tax=Microviridae sp. ctUND6 TaxID=2826736 RepID=A0A8S5QUP1_9VIRU|nr:MAG TPA: Major capsid protein [Microviridae sp. ctUND6]